MPTPADKLFIRPTNIDWDDDASIEAWAQHLWQYALDRREDPDKSQSPEPADLD